MNEPIVFTMLILVIITGLGCVSNINPDRIDMKNNGLLPEYVCPTTSFDTDTPCGIVQEGDTVVSGIYVPIVCVCPNDTYDYESNMIIGYDEFRMCVCLE